MVAGLLTVILEHLVGGRFAQQAAVHTVMDAAMSTAMVADLLTVPLGRLVGGRLAHQAAPHH